MRPLPQEILNCHQGRRGHLLHMKYFFLLLMPFIALAAEKKAKKYDMDDFTLGKVISGPTMTEMALKDKGIIVCLWLRHKDWHPESVFERLKKAVDATEGKVFPIAVETSSLNMNNKELLELEKQIKSMDVTYTVVAGLRKSPPKSAPMIPYCYVLNSKKVVIYSGPMGSPEFKEAMEQAAIPVVNPGDKPKDAKKEDKPKADPKKAA